MGEKQENIRENDNGHLFRYGDTEFKGTEEDGASALFRPFVR